ncbi:MAG: hypothetical protein U0T81_00820 [Saprospiraceae bacterium]
MISHTQLNGVKSTGPLVHLVVEKYRHHSILREFGLLPQSKVHKLIGVADRQTVQGIPLGILRLA